MFAVLSLLLTYALLSFGGVLPQGWLSVKICWIASVGFLLTLKFVRDKAIDTPSILFIAFSGAVCIFVQPKLGVGIMAAAWAWFATNRDQPKVLPFFRFLVLLGVLEALLGLFQYFLIPGWIFGYQNPFYRSTGTLINRNHFAGLLEMFIPVAFGLAYTASRRFGDMARPYLYLLAGAFMGLALLFSVSRMGIFSFLTTMIFLGIVLQLRKSQRKVAVSLGFGLIGLVLAGALWIGVDVIVQRYAELAAEDVITGEGRLLVFRDVLGMIGANPSGVGVGQFQDTFRKYQFFRPEALFDHAHNDFLETAAEWGLAVAATFWALLLFVIIRGIRLFVSVDSAEQRGIVLACTGAIFSILVHSLTDFNLQIPSNAMLFFTFVGISLAVPSRTRKIAD